MKKIVEKKQGRIIVRHSADDLTPAVQKIAEKMIGNDNATLTQRERDLVLIAILQGLRVAPKT